MRADQPFPHEDELRGRLLASRGATGKSYRWYAKGAGVPLSTLFDFATGGRIYFEPGTRLDLFLANHKQGIKS